MDLLEILNLIGIIILIVLICALLWMLVILRIIRKIHPFPIPAFFTKIIDNPIRRKFIQNPEKLAKRMHIEPGMKVIEIGPGKGSYTKGAAKLVHPNGAVYAVDISERVIDNLKKRVEKENLENIIPKIDDAYNLSFEDRSIDRVFAVTCLPEIPDPVKVLKECKRVLKPGGIVSLCEFFLDPDYPLRRTEKRWAKEAGLTFFEQHGNWFAYQLNFKKNQ